MLTLPERHSENIVGGGGGKERSQLEGADPPENGVLATDTTHNMGVFRTELLTNMQTNNQLSLGRSMP